MSRLYETYKPIVSNHFDVLVCIVLQRSILDSHCFKVRLFRMLTVLWLIMTRAAPTSESARRLNGSNCSAESESAMGGYDRESSMATCGSGWNSSVVRFVRLSAL